MSALAKLTSDQTALAKRVRVPNAVFVSGYPNCVRRCVWVCVCVRVCAFVCKSNAVFVGGRFWFSCRESKGTASIYGVFQFSVIRTADAKYA